MNLKLSRVLHCVLCVFFIYLPISYGQELEAGDRCSSKDGAYGVCKKILDCASANFEFEKKHFHTLTRCGFDEDMEIVCCLPDTYGDRFGEFINLEGPVPISGSPTLYGFLHRVFQQATDFLSKTTAVPGIPAAAAGIPASAAIPAAAIPAAAAIPVVPRRTTTPSYLDKSATNFVVQSEVLSTTPNSLRKAEIECQKLIARVPPPLGSYIIGGEVAEMGEFPHMIAIGFPIPNNSSLIEFKCGGSLVTEEFVLTAAHCVVSRTKRQIDVPVLIRAGIITIVDPTKRDPVFDYDIDRIIPHPEYYRKIHDIALVKLKRPVPVTASTHPACLFTKDKVPASGYITGWGITAFGNPTVSEVLLKANVTTISRAQCQDHYKHINIKDLKGGISDQMICAGTGGKDACQGDSGGPLQAQTEDDGHYRVFGVTSFGVGCGSSIPGVYTCVSSYLDWIESVVWTDNSE